MCDTNPLGALNGNDCFGKTQSLHSLIVEFVIGQDAIVEPADSEKIVHQIVVDDFIPQPNWTTDGHRQADQWKPTMTNETV